MQNSKFKITIQNSKLLSIDPKTETQRITKFIQKTLKQQGFKNVILASSGGIDSTTSLYLLAKALPKENIFVVHLPYTTSFFAKIKKVTNRLNMPPKNIFEISTKSIVDEITSVIARSDSDEAISSRSPRSFLARDDKNIRFGNIMARTRMIVLYDLAKKYQALVCGTENRSEYYLAYYTRFGDEASDFEPIRHLFKTQVYQLAKHLGVPKSIIDQSPTAGLWHGQTDEGEFGFTYEEADNVLFRYFDKKMTVVQIEKEAFPNAKKIIAWTKKNDYKHQVPYVLKGQ